MGSKHDHDAGGDSSVLARKAAIREEVWVALAAPGGHQPSHRQLCVQQLDEIVQIRP